MPKEPKSFPVEDKSETTLRQDKSPAKPRNLSHLNYPQKMLDEEDLWGIKGMEHAVHQLQRRRSMTDQEKLAALRAILIPPPKTLILDGPVQIVDRASYLVEAILSQIAVGEGTLDQTQMATLHDLKEKLAEVESILLPD